MRLPLFFIIISLAITSSAFASNEFIVKLHSANSDKFSKSLLFLSSGEVFEADLSAIEISQIKKALNKNLKIKAWAFEDKDDSSTKRRTMKRFSVTKELSEKARTQEDALEIKSRKNKNLLNETILRVTSPATVDRLFYSMRTDTKEDSQCYNRAHVWSWETRNTFLVNDKRPHLGKLWMFFTLRYIQEFDYKWWFHIAPFLKASYSNEDIVLDRSFVSAPVGQRQWSNFFMKNKAYCPEVKKYSDYEKRQKSNYCYHIKTSSYYWQPWHIEQLEDFGRQRTIWSQYDIEQAYANAIR